MPELLILGILMLLGKITSYNLELTNHTQVKAGGTVITFGDLRRDKIFQIEPISHHIKKLA
jgi:hypothetical protein